MRAGAILIDPKYPHNVGGALRACAVFGAERCVWTGTRVPPHSEWPAGARLPREERMKLYSHIDFYNTPTQDEAISRAAHHGFTPVAVEVMASSERLDYFEHPKDAIYVFGPEDGDLPGYVREKCYRFVTIPSAIRTPLNLAAAVNVVLYDRLTKQREIEGWKMIADDFPLTARRLP